MLATQHSCQPAVRRGSASHSRVVACAPKPASHAAAPASRVVSWRPSAVVAAVAQPQRARSRALSVRAAAAAAEVSWRRLGPRRAPKRRPDAASRGCSRRRRLRRSCPAGCLRTRRSPTSSRLCLAQASFRCPGRWRRAASSSCPPLSWGRRRWRCTRCPCSSPQSARSCSCAPTPSLRHVAAAVPGRAAVLTRRARAAGVELHRHHRGIAGPGWRPHC